MAIATIIVGYVTVWVEMGHFPGSVVTLTMVATVLNSIGNFFARDDDKTSEEVGAVALQQVRDKVETKELMEDLRDK